MNNNKHKTKAEESAGKIPLQRFVIRFFKLLYLVMVFHLPVWRFGYRKHKYRYLESMPKWMKTALKTRNDYERTYNLLDVFYWLKVGRFYIRKYHSFPMADVFKHSKKHLFCWGV